MALQIHKIEATLECEIVNLKPPNISRFNLLYLAFYCIYRYELIDILRNNNFTTPDMRISDVYVTNKRAKQTQRRILKGFNINTVDGAIREAFASKNGNPSKDFFKTIAKAISSKKESKCQPEIFTFLTTRLFSPA